MADWYRDHDLSPEASSDEEYRDWAYEAGAHIDLTGDVIWPDQPEHPDRQPGRLYSNTTPEVT